jgi:hypothetical protein
MLPINFDEIVTAPTFLLLDGARPPNMIQSMGTGVSCQIGQDPAVDTSPWSSYFVFV